MHRIIALAAAFTMTLLAQPTAAQECESLCVANPNILATGTVPTGTTLTYSFITDTDVDGTGTIVHGPEGTTCTTCSNCYMTLEFEFDEGSTTKEVCYMLDSWSNWQPTSGYYRTFMVTNTCDGTPVAYKIYIGESSTDCGVSPDYSAAARLYCGCT